MYYDPRCYIYKPSLKPQKSEFQGWLRDHRGILVPENPHDVLADNLRATVIEFAVGHGEDEREAAEIFDRSGPTWFLESYLADFRDELYAIADRIDLENFRYDQERT